MKILQLRNIALAILAGMLYEADDMIHKVPVYARRPKIDRVRDMRK